MNKMNADFPKGGRSVGEHGKVLPMAENSSGRGSSMCWALLKEVFPTRTFMDTHEGKRCRTGTQRRAVCGGQLNVSKW